MPRKKRLSGSEALAAVQAKITAAGGEMSHNDLVTSLDADGDSDVALYLVKWATKTGPLEAVIDVENPAGLQLSYRLRAVGGAN
jgi:hypothetical protein